ncbi:hypothetical protein NEOLEDRAFT_152209 [Neolentinus lepideus HHB14362 ss-1]|uniref:Uncharacterized protein n=1 Tax=Neolentinus lepideus HHB14362 ss-1 TaxID=1314782 RepID=A0A165MN33_9AGAM|nr:hypothetical protein NEOLEDRAFT_152209 [Neolentinus lepideus HHB14362 ss-1]
MKPLPLMRCVKTTRGTALQEHSAFPSDVKESIDTRRSVDWSVSRSEAAHSPKTAQPQETHPSHPPICRQPRDSDAGADYPPIASACLQILTGASPAREEPTQPSATGTQSHNPIYRWLWNPDGNTSRVGPRRVIWLPCCLPHIEGSGEPNPTLSRQSTLQFFVASSATNVLSGCRRERAY